MLGFAGATAAQPPTGEVIEQVAVSGDVRCGRVDIALRVPVLVVGHFPDTATRNFYVFVKVGAGSDTTVGALQGRESAVFQRGRSPWLEDVVYIGDLPGMQLLMFEVYEPALFKAVPGRDPRSMSALVTVPDRARECEPFSDVEEP